MKHSVVKITVKMASMFSKLSFNSFVSSWGKGVFKAKEIHVAMIVTRMRYSKALEDMTSEWSKFKFS